MTIQELEALVTNLRNIGNDTHTCEVKEAVGKLPSSIVDTLSAFSNGNGGTIILGLSEQNSFMPAPGFVASNMQNAIVAAGEKLTPVVRLKLKYFLLKVLKFLSRMSILCPLRTSLAMLRSVACIEVHIFVQEMAIIV